LEPSVACARVEIHAARRTSFKSAFKSALP
jgi:hypothetical protein